MPEGDRGPLYFTLAKRLIFLTQSQTSAFDLDFSKPPNLALTPLSVYLFYTFNAYGRILKYPY